MKRKYIIFYTKPHFRGNSKNLTADDLIGIRPGTLIKFKEGPYRDKYATILEMYYYEKNHNLFSIVINEDIITDLPFDRFAFDYVSFAEKILSTDLFIPKFDLFKKEYNSIIDINDEILHEIAKNPSYLQYLHPAGFENLVSRLYSQFGFSVDILGKWNQADGGVDIIGVKKDTPIGTFKVALQCKHTKNKIQPKIIRELSGVLHRHEAIKGIVITSNYFTKCAIQEAQNYHYKIELKDRDFLINNLTDSYR